MTLHDLGWTARHAQDLERLAPGLLPARVVREDADALTVDDGATTTRARARGLPLAPAVGDWVALAPAPVGLARVRAVLPRGGTLVRKAAGRAARPQVVAANVDVAVLVDGLDAGPNVRRLERYVALCRAGGVLPLVALAKADASPAPDAALAAVAPLGVDALLVSVVDGRGLDALRARLAPRATAAFLGPSGAGKSSLLNALIGEARQATAEVRAADARGRHTTTARELFATPWGALVVDTPGVREVAPWTDPATVDATFDDVADAARACRFSDCRHEREPGCAVRGSVGPERLAAWRKLREEQERLGRAAHERNREARTFGRAVKRVLHDKDERRRG